MDYTGFINQRTRRVAHRFGALTIGLSILASMPALAASAKVHPKSKPSAIPRPATPSTDAPPPTPVENKYVFDRSTRIVVDSQYASQLDTAAYWIQCYLCRVTGYSNPVVVGSPDNGDLFLTIDQTKTPLGFTLKMVDNTSTPTTPTATPSAGLQGRPYSAPPQGTKYVSIGAPDGAGVLKGALRLMGYLKASSTLSSDTLSAPPSKEVSITRIYQIAAGGRAVGTFDQDGYFWGPETKTATTMAAGASFGTTAVVDPAPVAVYESERYGEMVYTFPYLTPGLKYLVRLHFSENFYTKPGQRIFNVEINGAPVLRNFDIIAVTGGPLRAYVKEFTVQADGSGQIAITFSKGPADLPKISGIEILYVN